ncbi:hypothetical protein Acsp04_51040 [Actinomadura sp. NBRC 104425]|uniref:hypothetical protein n=1 Tax=Actinomadura sp. NBRC 104425 TaxID=3032204 RepID=UPI0024A26964|nr:hypothetical protein [Actinomadura sp. NBRC 104425]GLZ14869.1 hypothetical protein Acsp04_51040 [Actinomadura sp. NBRC 104425]
MEPEREPGGDQRNDVSKRAAAKEAQVREVVALIRARGYENVSLAVVQDELGLARTTAYNRLVEARARVNRAAS